MKRILWWLLTKIESNSGYSTSIQKRFNIGDTVKIRKDLCMPETRNFVGGGEIRIIETGRHDYLVQDDLGKMIIVYQFELQ